MTHTSKIIEGSIRTSLFDTSLWVIVASNIVSIVMALTQGWSLGEIIWIYWAQSVIIGAINVYRILALKEFSTEGMKQNGNDVPETQKAKRGVAFFFAFHYGFFHFVYFVMLLGLFPLTEFSTNDLMLLLLIIFGFFSAHGFSYNYNIGRDFKDKKPNFGTIMFYPYMRILPMHLTIIFGSLMFSTASLIFFMLLKTAADAGMHMVEHHMFQKKEKGQ